MLYYLHQLKDLESGFFPFEVFNVFQYQTFRAAGACLTAFLLSVLLGPRVIRILTALKMGQPIRSKEEVHRLAELHGGKSGTPTMGGILIVGAVLVAALLWTRLNNPFIQSLIFITLATGALGFVDDYLKVAKKNSAGVSGRIKLLVQAGSAMLVVAYLYANPATSDYIRALYVPFFKNAIVADMGIFTFLLLPLVIVGCSNAVNLTDGLDGLAAGCTVSTAMTYAIFTYAAGHQIVAETYLFIPFNRYAGEVSIFCAAIVGAGSVSSGTTATPRKSSWATPARSPSAGCSAPSRSAANRRSSSSSSAGSSSWRPARSSSRSRASSSAASASSRCPPSTITSSSKAGPRAR